MFDVENSTACIEEGDNATVCISISSSATELGCDLTFTLTTADLTASSKIIFSYLLVVGLLVFTLAKHVF